MTRIADIHTDAAPASVAGSPRRARRAKSHARRLLKALAGKKNILVTAHLHPDPDALASCLCLSELLKRKLPKAAVTVSFRGNIGGGLNETFAKLMALDAVPWSDEKLAEFDAIILLDTQPTFSNNPLPAGSLPLAVIDHHRSRGRRPEYQFTDIRPDVGATATIIFSYFKELDLPISPDHAATMLYAIESDLAGAAGQPDELDNQALSSLTLLADTRKLYRMRYVSLPRSYYIAYAYGLKNAMVYENALVSHIGQIDSPEKPAILADFLLRYDRVQWALVTALVDQGVVLSLRSERGTFSAADVVRRLLRGIGEGGGHRTKAGGYIPLSSNSAAEVERVRERVRRRLLRALKIPAMRGVRLVPDGNPETGTRN